MDIADILRYSFKALTEKKVRALLTIVGIAIGPLALVMMTSVVRGYGGYVESQLLGLGQNTVVVMGTSEHTLTKSDLDYIKRLSEVSSAEPFYLTQAYIQTREGRKQVYVYAIDNDILSKAISNLKLQAGKYPAPTDVTSAVIGHFVAYSESTGQKLYGLGDVLTLLMPQVKSGGRVTFTRATVRIIGVYEEYGGAMFVSPDTGVFLPEEAGKKLLHMNSWSGIFIIVKEPNQVNELVKELRSTYAGKVDIIAFQQIAKVVSSISGAMDFIAFSTSLSAFAVAVAGTAATMITSVIERTREIGVLKALGFTDGQVMWMIIAEAVLMSIIGGLIGVILGSGGAFVLASRGLTISSGVSKMVIKAPPKITASLLSYTLGITLAVGMIGGLIPAYRAAKIPPAMALRYE